jgi:hypothetical protein
MMTRAAFLFFLSAALGILPLYGKNSLTPEDRARLIRELMAEQGSAKVLIPRSKKALDITTEGTYDDEQWEEAMDEFGPAARLGDRVEITKIEFKDRRLVLELNHGIKGGRKWWHRIEMGSTTRGTTLGQGSQVYAPGGTKIALMFDGSVPALSGDEVKKMLDPVIDFSQRSATELYVEQLPPEFQEAIKDKRILVDMDQDMVLLAKGRPDRKYRESKDGVEAEDWIYGEPPGNVTFVTFQDGKVVQIRDSYASVGGEVKAQEPEAQK